MTAVAALVVIRAVFVMCFAVGFVIVPRMSASFCDRHKVHPALRAGPGFVADNFGMHRAGVLQRSLGAVGLCAHVMLLMA